MGQEEPSINTSLLRVGLEEHMELQIKFRSSTMIAEVCFVFGQASEKGAGWKVRSPLLMRWLSMSKWMQGFLIWGCFTCRTKVRPHSLKKKSIYRFINKNKLLIIDTSIFEMLLHSKWMPYWEEGVWGDFFSSCFFPLPLFFTLTESAAFEGLVKPKASRCSIKQIKSVRQAAICPIQ